MTHISNNGTNIVTGGWTFNAMLPINGSYTFGSQPQQALYPGDKIVYNLSFSNTFGSAQSNYGYTNGYTYPAGYQVSGYSCNGYNCAAPTNTTYPYNTGYNYNNTGYNYGNTYGTGYSLGTVTITADPQNYIVETNKANNTASVSTPIY